MEGIKKILTFAKAKPEELLESETKSKNSHESELMLRIKRARKIVSGTSLSALENPIKKVRIESYDVYFHNKSRKGCFNINESLKNKESDINNDDKNLEKQESFNIDSKIDTKDKKDETLQKTQKNIFSENGSLLFSSPSVTKSLFSNAETGQNSVFEVFKPMTPINAPDVFNQKIEFNKGSGLFNLGIVPNIPYAPKKLAENNNETKSSLFSSGLQNNNDSKGLFGTSSLFGTPDSGIKAPSSLFSSPFKGNSNIFDNKNSSNNTLFEQQNLFSTNKPLFEKQNSLNLTNPLFEKEKTLSSTNSLFEQQKPLDSTNSLFGQQKPFNSPSSLFGEKPLESTNSLFGQQKSLNSTTSLFGQQKHFDSNTSLFGQQKPLDSNGSLFGQQPPLNSSTSLFGQQKPLDSNTSLFGQKSLNSTSPLFGQQKPLDSSTSLFGQQKPLDSSTSLFGPKPINSATPLFGQPKPLNSSTSLFEQANPVSSNNSLIGEQNPVNSKNLLFDQQKTLTSTNSLFGPQTNLLENSKLFSGSGGTFSSNSGNPANELFKSSNLFSPASQKSLNPGFQGLFQSINNTSQENPAKNSFFAPLASNPTKNSFFVSNPQPTDFLEDEGFAPYSGEDNDDDLIVNK